MVVSRSACALAAVWLLSVLPADVADAQDVAAELRIRVMQDGIPARGALVALLDDTGGLIAEALTSEDGYRLFRAGPGTYRVRIRRIGYAPYTSETFTLPRADELVLQPVSPAVVLAGVIVSARPACAPVGDTAAVAPAWDEIAKALRASQLTTADLTGIGTVRTWRRETNTTGRVTLSDTASFVVTDRRPFWSRDPAELARSGYVRGDEFRGFQYHGPDETVLLSQEFVTTHCFALVRDSGRQGMLGVEFEPLPRRRVSDIAGVLWLDEATSELRELEFRYVNAGYPMFFSPGGSARFVRMPSGAWLVADWRIRAPRLRRQGVQPNPAFLGWIETGGRIELPGEDGGP